MDYPSHYPKAEYAAFTTTPQYPQAQFQVQIPGPRVAPQPQQNPDYAAYQSQHDNIASIRPTHQQLPPTEYFERVPLNPARTSQTPSTSTFIPNEGPLPAQEQEHEQGHLPPLDYQILLLSLAEDYFDAARGQGSMVALHRRNFEAQRYYKLIATGLGCLESILKVGWDLTLEAILHEETENDIHAEETLSKGITLCERNRLLDLKYQMQYLLIQVINKKNPKAAMRISDGIVEDVEAISALARQRGDDAIFLLSSILQAWTSLRSGSGDAIEQAQRATAEARSMQMANTMSEAPQLVALVDIIDVFCCLSQPNPFQAKEKLSALRGIMDSATKNPAWTAGGSFSLSIQHDESLHSTVKSDGALFDIMEDGSVRISFTWLPANEVIVMGYLLNGIVYSFEDSHNSNKAEKCFRSGLQIFKDNPLFNETDSQSLPCATSRLSNWNSAQATLDQLRKEMESLDAAATQPLMTMAQYLTGVVLQGSGRLAAALEIFDMPEFAPAIFNVPIKSSSQQVLRDVSVLATLNKIMILSDHSHSQHSQVDNLLSSVEPLCISHPNNNIKSAFLLLKATSSSNETVIKSKQYLQAALTAAKKVSNQELVCITLSFMSWKFFRGVVSEQAEKSTQAAYQTAKKSGNELWVNVAEEMMADTLEVRGKTREAAVYRKDAALSAQTVVPASHRAGLNEASRPGDPSV
ncbi:MAG: hypothetical protein M1837_001734 [Sclerophora amabilis]|nr:MAG: hypothetical protein M1837_001734 [Sclerophora amabilis]